MAYKLIHNVKRSVKAFLKSEIQSNSNYIVGDGATHLAFYDAFPTEPVDFHLPSISLDFERVPSRTQYDLGNDSTRTYDFTLEIFARNNLERELLSDVILGSLEDNVIMLQDYDNDPPTDIVNMTPSISDASPVRIDSPGGEQERRFRIGFSVDVNRPYNS